MKNQIYRDKEFKILSRAVDNATECVVTDVLKDEFKVELYTDEIYNENDTVELYTITDNGILYFETIVNKVKDKILQLAFPVSHKYLQRREYTRVSYKKDLVLVSPSQEEIIVSVIDISAGGLKIASPKQLELSALYDLSIELEKAKTLNCKFQPVRMEAQKEAYIISGRFQLLKNVDRVWLVQFCFKKELEEKNK